MAYARQHKYLLSASRHGAHGNIAYFQHRRVLPTTAFSSYRVTTACALDAGFAFHFLFRTRAGITPAIWRAATRIAHGRALASRSRVHLQIAYNQARAA
jgi:hypothetical protein